MSEVLAALSEYGDVTKSSIAPRTWKSTRTMAEETVHEVITFDEQETHLFVTSATVGFNDGLARAILAVLKRHRKKALAANPLALLDGLEDPGGRFDTVAVISNSTLRKYLEPALQHITQMVFPMYRCELSGDEDADLLRLIVGRNIRILEWNRRPNPIAWLKFVNTKIGIRSINQKLGMTTADELYDQLSSMRRKGSFADVMNFKKQRMHFEFDKGKYHISFDENAAPSRILALRESLAVARVFLENGLPIER
jgi:hypothetical protein